MVYYLLFQAKVIFFAFFKSKIKFTDPVTISFRVGFFNTDYFSFLQAGQYFSFTDIGRWECLARSGTFWRFLKAGNIAVIGSQKIIHRRPIRFLSQFQLSLQIVGWDEEWMYAAHVFHQQGKICAVSTTKVGLMSKTGRRSPLQEMKKLGYDVPPVMPEWVAKLFSSDKLTLEDGEKFLRENF